MAESVSQTEYDVTAYRNVLDQLNTVEGVVNDAMPVLKAQLALSLTAASTLQDHQKLSGWMMKVEGGKHPARWSRIVGPKLGIALDYGGWAGLGSRYGGQEPVRAAQKIKAWTGVELPTPRTRNSVRSRQYPGAVCIDYQSHGKRYGCKELGPDRSVSFTSEVQAAVYDAMNLFRNVNWELNRLRVQMPFDLRQLMSQLNDYASQVNRGDYADKWIATFKIFEEWQNLKKKVIPTMRSKLKERIKKAELEKKVAADQMRKENEETLTKAERKERQEERAITKLENAGAKVQRDGKQFIVVVGDRATTVERSALLKMAETAKQSVASMKEEKTYTTMPVSEPSPAPAPAPVYSGGSSTDQTRAENEKAMKEAAKQAGERDLTPAALGLALLALLSQG